MKGQVFRLLERNEVEQIVRELDQRTFVDGRVTADAQARGVKNNLQVGRKGDQRDEIDNIVIDGLMRHVDLQAYVLPTRFVFPIYSRYEPGMKYGDHVDNALMGGMNGIRTDFAVTVFLSPPASYDGGELVVDGDAEVKLDCGEAFVYPATSIHHVTPVTRGVRLAVVTWLQSAVRDETMRGILFDLSRAVRQADAMNNYEHSLLLSKSYHNLIRYAAEPK